MSACLSIDDFQKLHDTIVKGFSQYPADDHRKIVRFIIPVLDVKLGGITRVNLRGFGWFKEFEIDVKAPSPVPSLTKDILQFLTAQ